MNQLPRSTLDTDDLPERDRYEAWRDGCSVLVGYDMDKAVSRHAFRGRLDNILFDRFLLTQFSCPAGHHERSAARVGRDGADLVMLNLSVRGAMHFHDRGDTATCRPGDIIVIDYSRPTHSDHEDQQNIVLALPRDVLEDQLGALDDAHLCILPVGSAMTRILRAHMLSLQREAPGLSPAEGCIVSNMTVALAAAAIRAALGAAPDDSSPLRASMRARADRIIEQMLKSPELDPDHVARALPCSRSRLFSLYREDGGVASYILRRRLRGVLRELATPTRQRLSISAVAYGWGFNNISSFNRAFRAEFGIAPGTVRRETIGLQTRSAGPRAAERAACQSREHERWILDLLSSH